SLIRCQGIPVPQYRVSVVACAFLLQVATSKTDIMNTGKDNKNNVCVAVIDDNAQLRDMSVKQFEKSGYTVLFQTGNGQEVLQKLKGHDRWPDVCIIEEGFATAKLLLEKYPDLKV